MKDPLKPVRPRKPNKKRVAKPIYQFDLEGKLLYKHGSSAIACENLLIKPGSLKTAIDRKSCCMGKWYFSREKNFKPPSKAWSHNPLLSKNKILRPDTFFSDDFFDDGFI